MRYQKKKQYDFTKTVSDTDYLNIPVKEPRIIMVILAMQT